MDEGLVVIPKATISRLPLYLQVLTEYDHLGITLVSSEEIAQKLGITSVNCERIFHISGPWDPGCGL